MGKKQLDQAIAQETRKINLKPLKRIGNSSPIQPLRLSHTGHQNRVLPEHSSSTEAQTDAKQQIQSALKTSFNATSSAKPPQPESLAAIAPLALHPSNLEEPPKTQPDAQLEAQPETQTDAASPVLVKGRSFQIASVQKIAFPLQFQLKKTQWNWLILWLSVLCIFGGMGTSALLWLTGLPPLPNCGDLSAETSGMPRLYCAQQTARSAKLPDLLKAIALLKDWSPDQPFYGQAQELVNDWSELVLLSAQSKIDQNDLPGAIAAANQVPVSSPVYGKAQKAIAAWKAQWHKGDVLYAKAEIAIRTQNWKEAAAQVVEMGYMDHEYWRLQQADGLSKRILREKEARQALTQAQKLIRGKQPRLGYDADRNADRDANLTQADSNLDSGKELSQIDLKQVDPGKLGEAIALVQNVPSGTLAFPEAKAALTDWSQALLDWAMQQWQQGNIDLALATAQKIPFDPSLPIAGKDLIQFSHAQQRTDNIQQQGLAEQLWNLLEATSAVGKISPDSPVYALAQGRSQIWQARLQDMIQLQYANVLANLGDSASLRTAIDQAKTVTPDRPGRLSAQSLIARWNQELQKLEDRQYLIWAQEMAKSETVAGLKRAIAQAQEIPQNRALWKEAQPQIAAWADRIEVIEDQPFFDQAKHLAQQGKYPEAIEAAGKIHTDRALYAAAQNAIGSWQAQIRKVQTAEDQPILDQANALAARGRLTLAIEAASAIAPNRALYDQAQFSIRSWAAERAEVWRAESLESSEAEDELTEVGDEFVE
ncbi:MAG: hypothetical protein HY785_01300 [Oscillatoriophycideae cyanobacterium NC_groundwater_1537_Pr4_S-0.65um_50_18]|nr:hypothetical protein [Oscillatoriophycideae cyanobacterium NC_groundwater_1537_Pr4_S-0.65um_50_18]